MPDTHPRDPRSAAATCPKCAEAMEEGVLLDRGHANTVLRQQWFRGEPAKNWLGGLTTKGMQALDVSALRCTGCGYLELFAR